MSRTLVPERLSWASRLVDVRGPEHILEIGCGTGVALELVCAGLTTGHVTGVDRSATAITRAARRIADHLASGRATLLNSALKDIDLPPSSVDTAFAVNVNVFWTTSADPELATLCEVLRPGGVLHLIYETPVHSARAVSAVEAKLHRYGFATSTTIAHPQLAAVTGSR